MSHKLAIKVSKMTRLSSGGDQVRQYNVPSPLSLGIHVSWLFDGAKIKSRATVNSQEIDERCPATNLLVFVVQIHYFVGSC